MLRVHDVGTGYGPRHDFINVEVVIQLDSMPRQALGFQFRNDRNDLARQGALNLLRDAFNAIPQCEASAPKGYPAGKLTHTSAVSPS